MAKKHIEMSRLEALCFCYTAV